MNIWAKMVTALRGGINEAGESIVDSQALRILDQELRDATEELKLSRDGLAGIMARQKLAEEQAAQCQKGIEEYESYAVKALEKNDESLALEVAEKIAEYENRLSNETDIAQEYKINALELRKSIRLAEQNIRRLKQQIDTVKATENVQRAQAAIRDRYRGTDSKIQTAMESLERIKARQAQHAAEMEAAEALEKQETTEESLREKLEKAGIVDSLSNAEQVLERIKKQKK